MSACQNSGQIIAIGPMRLRMTQHPKTEALPAQHRRRIDKIWSTVQNGQTDALLNGALAHFIGVDTQSCPIEITGHFIEYKHFLAHRKQPALNLDIRPIGVSGILVAEEGGRQAVVVARRSHAVTDYPGYLELVPSGGIDQTFVDRHGVVDYSRQLLCELEQETGVSQAAVVDMGGFAFVVDAQRQVYDICCKITLGVSGQSVLAKFSSTEYGEPVLVAVKDWDGFIRANAGCIVPTSLALMEAYRQVRITP